RSIAELERSGLEPPAHIAELFRTAATAIARSARDVAERGRPDPEGAEFRQFAELLVKSMESEHDAVSIGSLYYSDSGPHIVSRGVLAGSAGARAPCDAAWAPATGRRSPPSPIP